MTRREFLGSCRSILLLTRVMTRVIAAGSTVVMKAKSQQFAEVSKGFVLSNEQIIANLREAWLSLSSMNRDVFS